MPNIELVTRRMVYRVTSKRWPLSYYHSLNLPSGSLVLSIYPLVLRKSLPAPYRLLSFFARNLILPGNDRIIKSLVFFCSIDRIKEGSPSYHEIKENIILCQNWQKNEKKFFTPEPPFHGAGHISTEPFHFAQTHNEAKLWNFITHSLRDIIWKYIPIVWGESVQNLDEEYSNNNIFLWQ